jgi:hypothetical protein
MNEFLFIRTLFSTEKPFKIPATLVFLFLFLGQVTFFLFILYPCDLPSLSVGISGKFSSYIMQLMMSFFSSSSVLKIIVQIIAEN